MLNAAYKVQKEKKNFKKKERKCGVQLSESQFDETNEINVKKNLSLFCHVY